MDVFAFLWFAFLWSLVEGSMYILFILLGELSSCFVPAASPLMSQMKTVQSREFKWPVQSHTASYWKGQGQNSPYGFSSPTPLPCCPGLSSQHPRPPPHPATSEVLKAPLIPEAVQGKERTGQAAPWLKHLDMKYSLQKVLESLLMNSRQPLRHTWKELICSEI